MAGSAGKTVWVNGYPGGSRHLRLAIFYRLPERPADDPQLRHLMDNEGIIGVRSRAALAGIRIIHVAQAVPHQPAEIEFVVEDAGAARAVPVDGRSSPGGMTGARNTAAIELERNLAWAPAGSKVDKDLANDRRFRIVATCSWSRLIRSSASATTTSQPPERATWSRFR